MVKKYLTDVANNAQSRTRTDDLRITNALLYQLSYLGKKVVNLNQRGVFAQPFI